MLQFAQSRAKAQVKVPDVETIGAHGQDVFKEVFFLFSISPFIRLGPY